MSTAVFKPETIVNEVFSLYESDSNTHFLTEPISRLQFNIWQTAVLAGDDGFEDEVLLAAFFHDIGRLCTCNRNFKLNDNLNYERVGADFLRERGFSERLASLVENQMATQRYLAYKYPSYYNQLSDIDKAKLQECGGVMSAQEAMSFELQPDAEFFTSIRNWDYSNKNVGKQLFDLNYIKLLTISHLYKNN